MAMRALANALHEIAILRLPPVRPERRYAPREHRCLPRNSRYAAAEHHARHRRIFARPDLAPDVPIVAPLGVTARATHAPREQLVLRAVEERGPFGERRLLDERLALRSVRARRERDAREVPARRAQHVGRGF